MRTPTLRELRESMFFSQNVPAVSEIGLTTIKSAPQPIGELCNGGCASWLAFLHLSDGHEGGSAYSQWLSEQACPDTPYPRISALWEPSSPRGVSRQYDPGSVPEALHHAFAPRSRLTTEGFHARRREDFAWSHFFPRSVGFGPTDSCAIGAFIMAPSMLCQDHAIPSISSYSARPLRHSRTKTPFLFHSEKYLCTELALPNSAFGNAFHWHPVRKTYTMAESTFRGSMAFRPPPARRRYFRLLSRLGFGISGSARFQNSSDIVHDFMAFIAWEHNTGRSKMQNII
jgi:hypothetical protein